MKSLVLLGVAALTLGAMGCSSDSTSSGTGGSASVTGGSTSNPPGPTGGVTGTATGGASGTSVTQTGGSTGAGTTAAQTGGATAGGATSTAATCGTANGTVNQASAFATTLDPWKKNAWPVAWTGNGLELVTTAPTGIDCSAGCAHLWADFTDGTAAYGGSAMEQYFGATDTSVENLLNETVTIKLAIVVTGAATVPAEIDLDGLDTFATTTYVDNVWVNKLGTFTALAAPTTVTYKVVDARVPSWAATRTVCASSLHTLRIVVTNSAAITADTAAKVDVYVQSVTIAP